MGRWRCVSKIARIAALAAALEGCGARASGATGPGCGGPALAGDAGAAGEAGIAGAAGTTGADALTSVCGTDTVVVHLLRTGYGGKTIPFALAQYGNCTAPSDPSLHWTVWCCPAALQVCATEGPFAACANVPSNPSSCEGYFCTCASPDGVATCFDP